MFGVRKLSGKKTCMNIVLKKVWENFVYTQFSIAIHNDNVSEVT